MTERRRAKRHGRRERRAVREPLGREAPGSALRGPPLSITCACGQKARLRYGSVWTCERCGLTWDTGGIPRAEYERIRRLQLRFRLLPVALGLSVVAAAAFFTLSGSAAAIFLLLPIALLAWFTFLRAPYRRRYRAAIAERQKWTLRAEGWGKRPGAAKPD
jgi:hypothetical protein